MKRMKRRRKILNIENSVERSFIPLHDDDDEDLITFLSPQGLHISHTEKESAKKKVAGCSHIDFSIISGPDRSSETTKMRDTEKRREKGKNPQSMYLLLVACP